MKLQQQRTANTVHSMNFTVYSLILPNPTLVSDSSDNVSLLLVLITVIFLR